MSEKTKANEIKEPSIIIPKRLLASQILVKNTGEIIKLNSDNRIFYSHLEDQFRGFTNKENIANGKSTGHYFDSDENLSIRCDISKHKVKESKRLLKALGLIDWKTPKSRKSGESCEYFVKSVDDVASNLEFIFQKLPDGKPSYDYESVSGKTKKTTRSLNNSKSDEQHKPEEQSEGQCIVQVDKMVQETVSIFDENRVVTEEFIRILDTKWSRFNPCTIFNTDGTLNKSYQDVYIRARIAEARRDGASDDKIADCYNAWIEEAKPENIPPHLLSKVQFRQEQENEFSNDYNPPFLAEGK
ncbi:DUF6945 domain-containing protein [Rahnella perminowiae]|uniref:DUF6945 domain-containing protein n=1 Tax=Rahnella perminowiae TaxID=2816244 RepID=UPI00215C3C11|nr:hypothetical protein [Rahnella perminowiae]MCR9002624.1 hypothetical protein [Rahnella perminowiae]